MSTMPAPVILRPTPQPFLKRTAGSLPDDAEGSAAVLKHAKWFATIPDAVAYESVRCLLNDMEAFTLDPTHQPDQDAYRDAYDRAGQRMLVYKAVDRFYALTARGVDPTVLLALRGTRLTHADRVTVAQSGLSPAEAHDQHQSGTLDMDTIRAMVALRQTS